MGNLNAVRKQLELVFVGYIELSDEERYKAMDMVLALQRQMLRKHSGLRQRLAELDSNTASDSTSHVEKARRKLVRKSNSSSPQPPIKPVQTTKKNELRRK
jgi:hypothetical protein